MKICLRAPISLLLLFNLPGLAYARSCDDPHLVGLFAVYEQSDCDNDPNSSMCANLEALQHGIGAQYRKCRTDPEAVLDSKNPSESPSTGSAAEAVKARDSKQQSADDETRNPLRSAVQPIAAESGDVTEHLARALTVLAIPIGTPLKDVRRMLFADSFTEVGQCGFIRGTGRLGGKGVTVMLSTNSSGTGCDYNLDQPVVKIYFQDGSQVMSEANHPALITRLNQEIGVEGRCKDRPSSKADCAWNAPPRFPNAAVITLASRGFRGFELVKENLKWPETPARLESVARTAFDPLDLIGDVDPLAPGGVAVGMALEDANKGLTASGLKIFRYGTISKSCEWQLQRPNEISLNIKVHARRPTGGAAPGFSQCMDGAIIQSVAYRKTDLRDEMFSKAKTGAETVASITQRLGNKASCKYIDGPAAAGGRGTNCRWASPPNAPGIESVSLDYLLMPMGRDVTLSLDLTGATVVQEATKERPSDTSCDAAAQSYQKADCANVRADDPGIRARVVCPRASRILTACGIDAAAER